MQYFVLEIENGTFLEHVPNPALDFISLQIYVHQFLCSVAFFGRPFVLYLIMKRHIKKVYQLLYRNVLVLSNEGFWSILHYCIDFAAVSGAPPCSSSKSSFIFCCLEMTASCLVCLLLVLLLKQVN